MEGPSFAIVLQPAAFELPPVFYCVLLYVVQTIPWDIDINAIILIETIYYFIDCFFCMLGVMGSTKSSFSGHPSVGPQPAIILCAGLLIIPTPCPCPLWNEGQVMAQVLLAHLR